MPDVARHELVNCAQTARWYAAGGGGAVYDSAIHDRCVAASGIGGMGARHGSQPPTNGAPQTGSGGGGGSDAGTGGYPGSHPGDGFSTVSCRLSTRVYLAASIANPMFRSMDSVGGLFLLLVGHHS